MYEVPVEFYISRTAGHKHKHIKVEAKQEQHVYRAIAAEPPAPDNSFLSFAVGNE